MFSINSTATYNRNTGEWDVDGIALTEDQVNAIVTLHKQLQSPFGHGGTIQLIERSTADETTP